MAWRGTSGCMRLTCWAQGCQASLPMHLCPLDDQTRCASKVLTHRQPLQVSTPGMM